MYCRFTKQTEVHYILFFEELQPNSPLTEFRNTEVQSGGDLLYYFKKRE